MTEFKPIKEGKVREIYDNGDSPWTNLFLLTKADTNIL